MSAPPDAPRPLAVALDAGETSALIYPAVSPPAALLVLAHGAGAGQRHPFMTAAARGLAARRISVVTFDFPYMHRRGRVPDRTPVLESCFRQVIAASRREAAPDGAPLVIGGKSMGGRMATHLAAQQLDGLRGVVALGYPLHPPGKPEQLRVAHWPEITVPLLVVQGERDTFGTPAELQRHLAVIPGAVTLHAVAGGDHSLATRRGASGLDAPLLDLLAGWITWCTTGAAAPAPPSPAGGG